MATSAKIEIIQGDSVERYFAFSDDSNAPVDPASIDSVYFTSDKISYQQKLEYDSGQSAYIFHMSPDETMAIPAGSYTYDITVQFADAKRRTATYNGALVFLKKINKVDYSGEG